MEGLRFAPRSICCVEFPGLQVLPGVHRGALPQPRAARRRPAPERAARRRGGQGGRRATRALASEDRFYMSFYRLEVLPAKMFFEKLTGLRLGIRNGPIFFRSR